MHVTTGVYAVTPTAAAYAPHNPHPGVRTRHVHASDQVHYDALCTYTYIHPDCAYVCGMSVPFVFTPRALCTAMCIQHAVHNLQKRNIPYRDAAAAHRGSWVKVVYVRSQFYFQFYFISRVIQSTVVVSADVFCDRLGGHCRGSVSTHVQTSSNFSIRRSQSTV